MGLEQVINDVQQGGERHAEEILAEARKEAEGILGKARDRAAAYHDARAAAGESDAAQQRAQQEKSAEFEARKMVLTKQAELQEELRGRVLAALGDLDAAARESHVKALLATAKGVIPEGSVLGASADAEVLGKQRTYKHAGDAAISGGIIVESTDGESRLDLSYEALVADKWRELLAGESALFG